MVEGIEMAKGIETGGDAEGRRSGTDISHGVSRIIYNAVGFGSEGSLSLMEAMTRH